MNTSKKVPAAIYLRASSAAQELSCGQQRDELKKLAEREGYQITAEYCDDGKSGSKDTDKRTGFLAMLADAKTNGLFRAVLVYDTARFGRLSSFKSGKYVEILMEADVFLHSAKEGKFNWNEPQGEMLWNMYCMGNRSYSTSLSMNSIRGRKDIANRKLWATGKVPFGYDRQYVDLSGTVKQVVKRSERFQKPRGWHLTLKINKAESEVVKLIFNRFATEDISLRELAAQLNRKSYVCGGNKWTATLVKLVLTSSAYIGQSSLGSKAKGYQSAHNRVGENFVEDACPVIVDKETYVKVQEVFTARAGKWKTKTASAGLLSGFLICGHCGKRMEKKKSHKNVIYQCATGNKVKDTSCKMWSVREEDASDFVIGYLEETVSAELLKLAEANPEAKPANYADVLRHKIQELKTKVSRGRRNALEALSPEEASAAYEVIGEWNAQIRTAETDLALSAEAPAEDWLGWWLTNREQLLLLWKTEKARGVSVALNDGSGWQGDGTPVLTNATKLRGLLRHLQLEVRFWWTEGPPDDDKPRGRGAPKKYRLTQRKLSLMIGGKPKELSEMISVVVERRSTTGVDILQIQLAV